MSAHHVERLIGAGMIGLALLIALAVLLWAVTGPYIRRVRQRFEDRLTSCHDCALHSSSPRPALRVVRGQTR